MMGGYGICIGWSDHFQINFFTSPPRYCFQLLLKEDASKIIEDDQRLVDLFVADMKLTYKDISKRPATCLHSEAPSIAFNILSTRQYDLILILTCPKDKWKNAIIFEMRDKVGNQITSWNSQEGMMLSKPLDNLFYEVDSA